MFQMKVKNGRHFGAALASALFVLILAAAVPAQSAPTPRTPTETVREFFSALKEKRFREALGISIYKPAIDGLSQKDFDELRPDFEAMALGAERIEITGEQISGDTSTVFVKMADDNGEIQTSKVDLMRINGVWTVGEAVNEKAVREAGKDYFFNVRIITHEEEVKLMMERIIKAQLVYNSQHNNLYADIPALVKAGLLPADIETTRSTGYKYRLTVSSDKKSYFAQAEPAQYGRTGRLSFHLDSAGVFQKKDVGGKPLVPEKK
jgi:hypothetical protein